MQDGLLQSLCRSPGHVRNPLNDTIASQLRGDPRGMFPEKANFLDYFRKKPDPKVDISIQHN